MNYIFKYSYCFNYKFVAAKKKITYLYITKK